MALWLHRAFYVRLVFGLAAFTYGFVTHAAGDMWGHTLINDFAGGVFPPFSELPTDIHKAEGVFDIDTVFAGILVLTIFALILDFIVTRIEDRLLVWRPRAAETETL